MTEFLINKLGLNALIIFINLFDKSLDDFSLNIKVKNKENIVMYFNKWKKIFNKSLNKHKKKALNIINEI
jgi:hypothetical protein